VGSRRPVAGLLFSRLHCGRLQRFRQFDDRFQGFHPLSFGERVVSLDGCLDPGQFLIVVSNAQLLNPDHEIGKP
jgi:hypothetical protein